MIHSLASFSMLALMSVVYMAAVHRFERLRLVVSNRQVSTMLGVFTFAGTVTLRPVLLAALVGVVYRTAWPVFKQAGMPAHRWVYNAASATVACLAASFVVKNAPAGWGLALAVAVFMLVNLPLSLAAVVVARHWHVLPNFKKPRMHWTVLSTQACGALVGVCMDWHAGLGVLGIPILAAIHSDALRGTLRDTNSVDDDGVCNRELFLFMAEESYRSGEWFSMVLLETPPGAAHRTAVDVTLTHARPAASPREADVVGVYSPTQVVLLRHLSPLTTGQLAGQRIAADLALLGVDATIGVADSKQGPVDVALVLASAEAALRGRSAMTEPEPR